jgi:hypothetical protein
MNKSDRDFENYLPTSTRTSPARYQNFQSKNLGSGED